MSQRTKPRLAKWPFFVADIILLAAAAWILYQGAKPLSMWPVVSLVACSALGAWMSIIPFLEEYRADLKFAEAEKLASTVEQLKNLRSFTNQITFATAQWQNIQENSMKSVQAAKEIADRIAADAQAFSEFMLKANDAEKAHLRLQNEKLRRSEGDWVQVVVHLLDHIYALQQAAVRSEQQTVIAQVTQLQNACRELVRRMGLTPLDAKMGDTYDEKVHVLPEGHLPAPVGASVVQALAPGYTFQGQHVRPALVTVKTGDIRPGVPERSAPQPQLELEEKK
jgi:molecular chaperone GrpE (heat shock protein)